MSGRLSRYLKQKVNWCKATGEKDAYGKHVRAEAIDIPCRIERRHRLTKDRDGKEVVANTTIFIEVPEGRSNSEDLLNDTLNGQPIISVTDMVGADGKVIGYEVLLWVLR